MLPVLGTIWVGVWLLATTPADPAGFSSLPAIAAFALLSALVGGALRRAVTATGPRVLAPAIVSACRTARRPVVSRLRDPDAAGRPRPRAPSADPAA